MARVRLTPDRIAKFSCPKGRAQAFLWDDVVRGLGVRVTPPSKANPKAVKAYVFQSRFAGRSLRLTIGDFESWLLESGDAKNPGAREKAREYQTTLDQGVDPRAVKANLITEAREKEKRDAIGAATFGAALREYVEKKRRAKDGLALKQRTKDDYLAMISPGRVKPNGTHCQDGELFSLADRAVDSITGDDIRDAHAAAMKRSERRAAYAMQVARAVLNWYGVKIPDNPLGKDVAGRNRIVIPQARATGSPIPAEKIGAWWRALDAAANPVSRDFFRFLLLTGARVSEPKNLRVVDCDLTANRVILRDTKNRSDHVILLSRQAREIIERNVADKLPEAAVFDIVDGNKTRATVARRSGIAWRAKDLRSTFVSIAEEHVTAYALKAMVNHANAGDVTGRHYVRKGESALREGWQAVADFIDKQAKAVAPIAARPVRRATRKTKAPAPRLRAVK